MDMKQKAFYEPPVSQGLWFRAEGVVCSSTTEYNGAVNDFGIITEIDVSDLWNTII